MPNPILSANHGVFAATGSNSTGLLHRTPALVNHAEALARLAGASPEDERALIVATYLMAGAAIEGYSKRQRTITTDNGQTARRSTPRCSDTRCVQPRNAEHIRASTHRNR